MSNVRNTIWNLTKVGATAIVFALIGWGIPKLYYRHFDTTVYYKIQSPIVVLDTEPINPCGIVHFRMYRSSLVNSTSETITQLELIKDGTTEIVEFVKLDGIITDTNGNYVPIDLAKQIPCNIEDGIYYWRGVAKYEVRENAKEESFFTDKFEVKN